MLFGCDEGVGVSGGWLVVSGEGWNLGSWSFSALAWYLWRRAGLRLDYEYFVFGRENSIVSWVCSFDSGCGL